jgi:predicted ArsR family transcriptional regulator
MTPAQIEFIKAHPFAFTELAAQHEDAIARRIQKAVAKELRRNQPSEVGHKYPQKNYPEIEKLFCNHGPIPIAKVAAAAGISISTAENRLSSLVVRGFLRVERLMHDGKLVKGHIRADAPVKPKDSGKPCNQNIMAIMADKRERTASDIALRLNVSPYEIAKDLAKLSRDGHIKSTRIAAGSGPWMTVYRMP